MGKRSNFARIERDYYRTPASAVEPLLPHLADCTWFIECCAGDGSLVRHLTEAGHLCDLTYDIEPQVVGMETRDALTYVPTDAINNGSVFISNTPWRRDILHPLIEHLSNQAPTWLLFDSDWHHTRQSAALMRRCRKIVSVGRVKWIEGSANTGKDNCCWYLFGEERDEYPVFVGRR